MKLFFNYRRDDTDDLAGRLHDRLSVEFGAENIFKDVDSIRPGQNWRVALERSIASSDIVLAIIGKQWLTITDELGQRRIDAEEDFVRFELEAARRAGKIILPVVVKGASIPNPSLLPESIRWLCDFQQSELRADPFFKDDVARLLAELVRIRDRLKDQQAKVSAMPAGNRNVSHEAGGILRCSSCHAQCDRSSQYCDVCGAGLWTTCPSCELPVPQNQVFCSGCGSNLPKLRELIEFTEKTEKRFARTLAIADPGERMHSMATLAREIEAAIRIYPKHQPLAHLHFQATEVHRRSARDLADAVYESGKLDLAREQYTLLKQIDPLSEHANVQLAAIDARFKADAKAYRERIAKGDFKRAIEIILKLVDAFPEDRQLREDLQQCQAIQDRIVRLIPEGIRDLKRRKQFLALEQELLWLRQQKIPVRKLDEWLQETKSIVRQANHEFLQAQSELREGRFRQTRKLANVVLNLTADHAGARELLAATSGTELMIAKLNGLLRKQQYCAANQLVKKLAEDNISDPRVIRLAAATNVEITTLDSSIRLILMLFIVAFVPGYIIGNKVFEQLQLSPSATGSLVQTLIWLASISAIPVFLATVLTFALPNGAERISRFVFDWLPFGRLTRMKKPAGEQNSESDEEEELNNTAELDSPAIETPVPEHSLPGHDVATVSDSSLQTSPAEVQVKDAGSVNTTRLSGDDPPDPLLTVGADRSAGLLEMLSVGVLLYCVSVACGNNLWNWLLGLRFDASVETDARTVEILRPFSSVFPLLGAAVIAVFIESASRWRRILTAGGIGILIQLLTAILFPTAAKSIQAIVLGLILLLVISEVRRVSVGRVLLVQLGALTGATLVFSAAILPLLLAAILLGFESRSIPAVSFLQVCLTSLLMCQIYVSGSSAGSLQISRLAADYPAVRGTMSIGAGWIAAAIITISVSWLTSIVREEWHGVAKWVLLIFMLQMIPFGLSGRLGLRSQRLWLLVSVVWTTTVAALWWLLPTSALLMFPVTFAFSAISLLRLETCNVFTHWNTIWQQIKVRHSRRMFVIRQVLRRN
ncbi:MAG: TIR domain-containing protein [Planctomycetaceae bacterium]|nr:TIR domain-containing protein [Planctomycetaceae bacterium]